MRIYVETNFVLELALEQEQHAKCEALLDLVEANGALILSIPAFCFTEPFETLRRRQHERGEFAKKFEQEIDKIKRSPKFTKEAASDQVKEMLLRSIQEAGDRLNSINDRLLKTARVLPLTSKVLTDAVKHRQDFGLHYPDAQVLASILNDEGFGQDPSCFINKNTKDFDDPSIVELLKQRHCKLVGNFEHGLKHVQSELKKP